MTENNDDGQRHSQALEANLVTDPVERAKLEAKNGLRQYDYAVEIIQDAVTSNRSFKLRLSTILSLQRIALDGISAYAGNFRPAGVEIKGSGHNPPGAHLVAELIENMCDYVNENWETKSALHLSAYIMWRLNWIHPFADGNGRTSRTVAYLILCIRLGYLLPGTKTIPDQIAQDRDPYYQALEAIDKSVNGDKFDLMPMETLLSGLLAKQLVSVHEQARGSS